MYPWHFDRQIAFPLRKKDIPSSCLLRNRNCLKPVLLIVAALVIFSSAYVILESDAIPFIFELFVIVVYYATHVHLSDANRGYLLIYLQHWLHSIPIVSVWSVKLLWYSFALYRFALVHYITVVHNLFRPRATNRSLKPFGGQTDVVPDLSQVNACQNLWRCCSK